MRPDHLQSVNMIDSANIELVEEDENIDLDSGWARVDVEQAKQAAELDHSCDSAAVAAYMISETQKLRPRSESEYSSPKRTLPYPWMQPVDSPLLFDPCAWACAGIQVTYVVWHFIPALVRFWQALKLPEGKPPCPCCWQHAVQVDEGRQLTVAQCYQQLSKEKLQELRSEGKLGLTKGHGYLSKPYRVVGLGKPSLFMAFQYKCAGCPAAGTTGRKATKNSFFMATDKRLLDIMESQGLRCFVDSLELHRGARVGLDLFVAKLFERGVPKAGNVKDYVDTLCELSLNNYMQTKLGYYELLALAPLIKPNKQQATIEQCFASHQLQQQAATAALQQSSVAIGSAAAAAAQAPPPAGRTPSEAEVDHSMSVAGQAAAVVARKADMVGAELKRFPHQATLPGAAVSQTYITSQLHAMSRVSNRYKRSVMEAAAANSTVLSADYTHYATKMVHTNGGRVATAMFNLMDVKTGAILVHLWTQSVEVAEVKHVLEECLERRKAANSPSVEVIYVDDPKLFGVLAEVFKDAKLVQDGFHVLDRFSRVIPAENTTKATFMSELARAVYVENKDDVAAVSAAMAAAGRNIQELSQAQRNVRIRRNILEGSTTQAAVAAVIEKFRNKVCPVTGSSVVTEELLEVYRNQAATSIMVQGKLQSTFDMMQDQLPQEKIYVQKEGSAGVDEYGLKLYWCYRGTSYEEGMHGQLGKLFKSGHTGPELAQLMLLAFFYRRAVDALLKAGTNTYGTYDLWLLEKIKAAQAAVGAADDYPDWKPVPPLEDPLPSFGMDFTPRSMLPATRHGLDLDFLSEFDELVQESIELGETRQRLALKLSDDNVLWDIQSGKLIARSNSTMYCKACSKRQPILVEDGDKVLCTNGHMLLDLHDEVMKLESEVPAAIQARNRVQLSLGSSRGPATPVTSGDAVAGPSNAARATGSMQCDSSVAAAAAATDVELLVDQDAGGSRPAKRARQQLSISEKVRRSSGKNEKTPGANFSISRFFAPVSTETEEQLFWILYNKYTKGGTTQWLKVASVWNFKAMQQHQRGNFLLSYKTEKHLKDFHKHLVKGIAQQLSTPMPSACAHPANPASAAAVAAQQALNAAAAAQAAASAAAAAVHAANAAPSPHGVMPLQSPVSVQEAGTPVVGVGDLAGETVGAAPSGSGMFAALGRVAKNAAAVLSCRVGVQPHDSSTSKQAAADAATVPAVAGVVAASGTSTALAAAAAATAGSCPVADACRPRTTGTWLDDLAARSYASAEAAKAAANAGASAPAQHLLANRVAGAVQNAAASAAAPLAAHLAAAACEAGLTAQEIEDARAAAGDAANSIEFWKHMVINGIPFPAGYPKKMPSGRKISECGNCQTPTRMPDSNNIGRLILTPHTQHKPSCSRFSGTRTFITGKKKGATAASTEYRRKD